jgi:hypothetical protein
MTKEGPHSGERYGPRKEEPMNRSVSNLPLQSKTQRAAILRLLIDARGAWVPLPQILDLHISQFGARIFELRRLGFSIENRTERDDSGVVHSWYRVVGDLPKDESHTPKPSPEWQDRPRLTGLPLWDIGAQP